MVLDVFKDSPSDWIAELLFFVCPSVCCKFPVTIASSTNSKSGALSGTAKRGFSSFGMYLSCRSNIAVISSTSSSNGTAQKYHRLNSIRKINMSSEMLNTNLSMERNNTALPNSIPNQMLEGITHRLEIGSRSRKIGIGDCRSPSAAGTPFLVL